MESIELQKNVMSNNGRGHQVIKAKQMKDNKNSDKNLQNLNDSSDDDAD